MTVKRPTASKNGRCEGARKRGKRGRGGKRATELSVGASGEEEGLVSTQRRETFSGKTIRKEENVADVTNRRPKHTHRRGKCPRGEVSEDTHEPREVLQGGGGTGPGKKPAMGVSKKKAQGKSSNQKKSHNQKSRGGNWRCDNERREKSLKKKKHPEEQWGGEAGVSISRT